MLRRGSTYAAGLILAACSGGTTEPPPPPPPLPQPTLVTWRFCDPHPAELPVWFAAQDGDGAWKRITGSGGSYPFPITAKGAVAWVRLSNIANYPKVALFFGSLTDLQAQSDRHCLPSVKSVSGSIAGAILPDLVAHVLLGGQSYTFASFQPGPFTMTGVADGPHDLLAWTDRFPQGLELMVLRRSLNPPAGSTLPEIDFASTEALPPVQRIVTIGGGKVENTVAIASSLITPTDSLPIDERQVDPVVATGSLRGVPAAIRTVGDLHLVEAFQDILVGAHPSGRTAGAYVGDFENLTLTLGSDLPLAVITKAEPALTPLIRVQLARQPEYDRLINVTWLPSDTLGITSVDLTAAYLGSGASFDWTMPDLSGLAGWDSHWGIRVGAPQRVYLTATGWSASGGVFQAPRAVGTTRSAWISQVFQP